MTTATPQIPQTTLSRDNKNTSRGLFAVSTRAFLALFRRDLLVVGRQFVPQLIQSLMVPLFFLFIFGKVLTQTGAATSGYSTLLLPGMVAMTIVMNALTSITLPLLLDIGNEREIEDRLMAPLPINLIAIEKVIFAAVNSIITGAIVFPLAYWVLGSDYHVRGDAIGVLIIIMVLTAFAGASLGLTLGTAVKPEQIGMMNAVIIMPLIFTGCVYFSWSALDSLKWFQIATLINPLTYAAEGLRYAMTPAMHGHTLPTLAMPWVYLGLVVTTILFLIIGMRGFSRRVVG